MMTSKFFSTFIIPFVQCSSWSQLDSPQTVSFLTDFAGHRSFFTKGVGPGQQNPSPLYPIWNIHTCGVFFILLFNLYLQFSVISPFICKSPISSQGIHRSLLVPTDLSIWLSKLSKERDRWGIKWERKDSNKCNRKSEKYHSIKNLNKLKISC